MSWGPMAPRWPSSPRLQAAAHDDPNHPHLCTKLTSQVQTLPMAGASWALESGSLGSPGWGLAPSDLNHTPGHPCC